MGLEKVGWLTDPSWAMPSIAIMATWKNVGLYIICLLYTSDAADERSSVDLGGRRIIKKKKR